MEGQHHDVEVGTLNLRVWRPHGNVTEVHAPDRDVSVFLIYRLLSDKPDALPTGQLFEGRVEDELQANSVVVSSISGESGKRKSQNVKCSKKLWNSNFDLSGK